jgi:hypothetical protein
MAAVDEQQAGPSSAEREELWQAYLAAENRRREMTMAAFEQLWEEQGAGNSLSAWTRCGRCTGRAHDLESSISCNTGVKLSVTRTGSRPLCLAELANIGSRAPTASRVGAPGMRRWRAGPGAPTGGRRSHGPAPRRRDPEAAASMRKRRPVLPAPAALGVRLTVLVLVFHPVMPTQQAEDVACHPDSLLPRSSASEGAGLRREPAPRGTTLRSRSRRLEGAPRR